MTSAATGAIAALDHVGFSVGDLDRSVAFYTRLLGAGPTLRRVWDVPYLGEIVGYPGCRMECAFYELPGGTMLELLHYLDPPAGRVEMETYNAGNGHLCLVVGDLRAELARVREFAAVRSEAPVAIPWGPYAGGLVAYVRDPDGISIELMQHPPGGPRL